jgi:hypothetical protein
VPTFEERAAVYEEQKRTRDERRGKRKAVEIGKRKASNESAPSNTD